MSVSCVSCGRPTRSTLFHATLSLAGRSFKETIPATTCGYCGQTVMSGQAAACADEEVAFLLCATGDFNGDAIRFVRRALGYQTIPFACVLGVSEIDLLFWERGGVLIPPSVRAKCEGIVKDRLLLSPYAGGVQVIEICEAV